MSENWLNLILKANYKIYQTLIYSIVVSTLVVLILFKSTIQFINFVSESNHNIELMENSDIEDEVERGFDENSLNYNSEFVCKILNFENKFNFDNYSSQICLMNVDIFLPPPKKG